MGIVHIMGVGNSPGVVTTAMWYMATNQSMLFSSSGSPIADKVVFFTTPDVFLAPCPNNRPIQFAFNTPGETRKAQKRQDLSCWNIVADFIKRDKNVGKLFAEAEFWFLQADIVDVNKNIETLLTFLAAETPRSFGKQGKEVWINLTGGTNVINISLLLTAYLSGAASTAYYTFCPREENHLLYPGPNFRWNFVPVMRVDWKDEFLKVLEYAHDRQPVKMLEGIIDNFKQRYLVKMGALLSCDRKGLLQLTEYGRTVLHVMKLPLLRHAAEGREISAEQVREAKNSLRSLAKELHL